MSKIKDRPNFVRKKKESKESEIPIGLRDLGIKLSESLPTYDVPIDLIERTKKPRWPTTWFLC